MFLFIIITSLFIASCEKSNERCENSHCDVLTCKIDGVSWAPYCNSNGDLFGCGAIRTRHYKDFDSEYVSISGGNSLVHNGIDIFVYLINETYPELENRIDPIRAYIDGLQPSSCTWFHVDSTLNQQFNLYSIDYEKRIIEGTFYFSVKNECDSTDLKEMTDGYFNLSF